MAKIKNLQEVKNEIIDLYTSGKSMREINKETGRSRGFISKIIKSENIEIRDTSITSKIYSVNDNYFKEIDNPDKAYWLGFIYADGFIESKRKNSAQKIGITLSSVDEDHLYKFKECIEATNPIRRYTGSGYNKNGEYSKILITSQELVNDLKKYGVVENKTLLLDFPNIDDRYIKDFIRGYLDGDGSIYKYSNNGKHYYGISFVGTEKVLNKIRYHLGGLWKIRPNGNVYEMKIGGNKQLVNILSNLYSDANIYLDRKYDKYLELLKYSES